MRPLTIAATASNRAFWPEGTTDNTPDGRSAHPRRRNSDLLHAIRERALGLQEHRALQVRQAHQARPEERRSDPVRVQPELVLPERPREEQHYRPAREPDSGRSDCKRPGKSRLQARQVLLETSFLNSYAGEN